MATALTATEPHCYTIEEYLSLEKAAEYKSEYRDGEIISMTGGTINHNRIIGNLHAGLKLALKGQDYAVFSAMYGFGYQKRDFIRIPM